MRIHKRRVLAFCSALVLACSIVSCGGKKDGVAVSQSDAASYGVDDGSTFPVGVWAVDSDEQRTGYYIFREENSGSYLDTQTGMGVGFEVEVDGKRANFHKGAADVNDYAQVTIGENGKRLLTWEEDSLMENLTLLRSVDPNTFAFYASDDLVSAAYRYYETQNGGEHPAFSGARVNTDGTVDIQLFDLVDGHNSTAAYYHVDSITGKGQDVNSGEAVDFSQSE